MYARFKLILCNISLKANTVGNYEIMSQYGPVLKMFRKGKQKTTAQNCALEILASGVMREISW
jgi:hypothetical protein